MILILAVSVYVLCAILTWGLYHGNKRYASYSWLPWNKMIIVYGALMQPVGLITILLVDGAKHFSLKPMSKEECWQAWIQHGYGSEPTRSSGV